MSESTMNTRRRMQAEHIVNSLKMKNDKFHLTPTKKFKKLKKSLVLQKYNRVTETPTHMPSNQSDLWFRDEEGNIKVVNFVVQKAVAPPAKESNTFSSMFKQLAQKFKGGATTENPCSKVFFEKESNRVYIATTADSDQQFEIYQGRPQSENNSPVDAAMNKIDYENLLFQFNLNYLY